MNSLLMRLPLVLFLLFGILLLVFFFIDTTDVTATRLREVLELSEIVEFHKNVNLKQKRPVIGILTQPSESGQEYIAASYVKYCEAAGARVVPIRYWWSEEEVTRVFKGINGVLLPGGGASLDPKDSRILKTAKVLYQLAEESNKKGLHFPIWGTCLGWELLAVLATGGDYSILTESGKFMDPGRRTKISIVNNSELFKDVPSKEKRYINHGENLFYFSHENGVTPEMFRKMLDLKCWKIVSISQDMKGKDFVSSAESTCRPYYGVQFHPEKNLFEWFTEAEIPHSYLAGQVTHHFIRFLAKQLTLAREGNFKEKEIFDRDVHHFPIHYMGNGYFFQIYEFPDQNETTDTESKSIIQ